MLFDDVVLPLWALALEDADFCQGNAGWLGWEIRSEFHGILQSF
jgi:hypothetical protein